MKRLLFKFAVLLGLIVMLTAFVLIDQGTAKPGISPIEELGKFLYFDENLSEPSGQSCASCHHPDFGFVDPDSDLPVSEGVILGMFGGRNSPSSAYAMYSPPFFFDEVDGLYVGGLFWDGRATGAALGDPLADQAAGPFTNPVEMHNPDRLTVVRDVALSDYAYLYEQVWPNTDLDQWDTMEQSEIDLAYEQIAISIAAFERTRLFAQFNSKYDSYLAKCIQMRADKNDCAIGVGKKAEIAGKKYFSDEEWRGLQLFMGDNDNDGVLAAGEGAMCAACHVATWTRANEYSLPVQVPDWAPGGWVPPVFTDSTFDNLGVPKNVEFPFDPDAPVDLGLGKELDDPAENGKFRVMTLRNIGLSMPYAHNGYFKTLKDIVHFYNTRDVPAMGWDLPEYPDTMNVDELGNLGLSEADENALVAFMLTLSDGTWR